MKREKTKETEQREKGVRRVKGVKEDSDCYLLSSLETWERYDA